jgi:hypothetical protein
VTASTERLVAVAGDSVTRPLYELDRACDVLLDEEQRKLSPDNALIAVLCDTVRLIRESEKLARAPIAMPDDDVPVFITARVELPRHIAGPWRDAQAHISAGIEAWGKRLVTPIGVALCRARYKATPNGHEFHWDNYGSCETCHAEAQKIVEGGP